MGIKEVKQIVELQIEENFQRKNQLALEIERNQNSDLLRKRAEIRNEMRRWWEKVLGMENVEAGDVGRDHQDLIFLRMAKWWVMEEEAGESRTISRDRLSDWIKVVPKGMYVFENAKFEERAWAKAEEIFDTGVSRLSGTSIGIWKIFFKDKLVATFYNFGDVIEFKLKKLEKELELDEQLPVSLKHKMMFRIKEILTIKMAKLLDEKIAKGDENFAKIRQIIEGALNNNISIGLILKFLEHADEEFPSGLPKEKIISSIVRWMRESLLNNDINTVLIAADQLMRFKMISLEDLQKALRETLERRIKIIAEKVCVTLRSPEDFEKLINTQDRILAIYHQNTNSRNSETREAYREKDLEENYKIWRKQFDDSLELAKMIGLIKPEEAYEKIG